MHQWEPLVAPGPKTPWSQKPGGGLQEARIPIIVRRAVYNKDELGTYRCTICGCTILSDEVPEPQPKTLQGCIRLAPKRPAPTNEVA